ncbi:hypothetical protein BST81_13755 [Leptolyngbya sp. 'hensonii']|uniref:hypothetical protein n=1 Tax=Leptolyngbya sp. 'hensonii' TaxID=1922337 RepID=UPI00094F59DB|nr:hypothetical protein [Leptolyngbya sp. 'hensonii']OLP18085.1 hypothetical protein BST81_13755 [Leptolyngbya sp. 'hensonii']
MTSSPTPNSPLILPGHPLFDLTLASPPPNWGEVAARDGNTYALVAEPGSGIMRPATQAELEDYLYGGEYDERMDEIGEWDDLD